MLLQEKAELEKVFTFASIARDVDIKNLEIKIRSEALKNARLYNGDTTKVSDTLRKALAQAEKLKEEL